MNQPQHSELFKDAFNTMMDYKPDASSAALERHTDDLIDGEGYVAGDDDVSEKTFTDRLLSDPDLWRNHCCEAIMPNDDACIDIMIKIKVCDINIDAPDKFITKISFEELGKAVYNEVIKYAEVLGDE